MKSNPKEVIEHKLLILRCLSDDDITIRSRALELLTGMVSKRNLQELISQLMTHVDRAEGEYRNELIQQIVFICSRDKYEYLNDFKWYVTILVSLSKIHGTTYGKLIAEEIINVGMRVLPIRDFVVNEMSELVLNSDVCMGRSENTVIEVLHAAAFIVGEFALSCAPASHSPLIATLISPQSLTLPPRTQSVYIQSAFKVFATACGASSPALDEILSCITSNLTRWRER